MDWMKQGKRPSRTFSDSSSFSDTHVRTAIVPNSAVRNRAELRVLVIAQRTARARSPCRAIEPGLLAFSGVSRWYWQMLRPAFGAERPNRPRDQDEPSTSTTTRTKSRRWNA
jgi:hypothetical protein